MVIAVVDLLAIVPRGTYYSAARYNEGGDGTRYLMILILLWLCGNGLCDERDYCSS